MLGRSPKVNLVEAVLFIVSMLLLMNVLCSRASKMSLPPGICCCCLQQLRIQLHSLQAYLFSCKQPVAEELLAKVNGKSYLLDFVHVYSLRVRDVIQYVSNVSCVTFHVLLLEAGFSIDMNSQNVMSSKLKNLDVIVQNLEVMQFVRLAKNDFGLVFG